MRDSPSSIGSSSAGTCVPASLVVILLTMDLTDTQQAILQLIAERIESEGAPPSQTEIARAFGFKGVRAAQRRLEMIQRASKSLNSYDQLGRARTIDSGSNQIERKA